jgi:hypothetical protein
MGGMPTRSLNSNKAAHDATQYQSRRFDQHGGCHPGLKDVKKIGALALDALRNKNLIYFRGSIDEIIQDDSSSGC